MPSILSLWLPVLVSAVFVFIASSLIHMVFKWHNSDYRKLSNEDEVRAAIRKDNPAPGQYVVPYCADMKDMGGEEMQKKYVEGPLGFLYLKPAGVPSMGPSLISWFLYTAVVALFAGILTQHALPVGAHYRPVFHRVALATFMAYGLGSIPAGIWMGKPWRSVLKEMFDAVIYALLTAGTFGWLWPR